MRRASYSGLGSKQDGDFRLRKRVLPDSAGRNLGQLELFPTEAIQNKARRGLIDGLLVHIDRHCRCGCTLAAIVEGKVSPHAAALKCRDCGRFRQWLPATVFQFLVELVACFGRPQPIDVYECVNWGTERSGRMLLGRRYQRAAKSTTRFRFNPQPEKRRPQWL